MNGRITKRLHEKALIDFLPMKRRHPDLTFKKFFRSVKRLYLNGELKLNDSVPAL